MHSPRRSGRWALAAREEGGPDRPSLPPSACGRARDRPSTPPDTPFAVTQRQADVNVATRIGQNGSRLAFCSIRFAVAAFFFSSRNKHVAIRPPTPARPRHRRLPHDRTDPIHPIWSGKKTSCSWLLPVPCSPRSRHRSLGRFTERGDLGRGRQRRCGGGSGLASTSLPLLRSADPRLTTHRPIGAQMAIEAMAKQHGSALTDSTKKQSRWASRSGA